MARSEGAARARTKTLRGLSCAALVLLFAGLGGSGASTRVVYRTVPGPDPQTSPLSVLDSFRPPPVPPPGGKLDRLRLALGRDLFFDPILSRSQAISCATCHNPGLSWASGLKRPIGDSGVPMLVRSPTLIDVGGLERLGWDGKYPDIESVTFAAVEGHANMNLTREEALQRLRANAGYAALFAAAFPGQGVTADGMAAALAAFERSIRSGEAPFDRFVAGDKQAIGPAARRGFALFTGRAGCVNCHAGWAFTDGSFHDIGSATGNDIGRGRLFPTSRMLKYAFKTPTLRDVARRAPYMHDGSLPDLDAVLALYDQGGIDRPSRSELIRPLHLSAEDKADLIAFLHTLTEQALPVSVPILPR